MLLVLDITISGIGLGGLDPQGDESIVLADKAQGFQTDFGEGRRVQDQVVRGSHDQRRFGIFLQQLMGDIGNAGCRIFSG